MPPNEFPQAIGRRLLVGAHQGLHLVGREQVLVGLHIGQELGVFQAKEGCAKNLPLKQFQQVFRCIQPLLREVRREFVCIMNISLPYLTYSVYAILLYTRR